MLVKANRKGDNEFCISSFKTKIFGFHIKWRAIIMGPTPTKSGVCYDNVVDLWKMCPFNL